MTIGYYDYDGWLKASPPCRRAVSEARRLLEARGHKLVPITLPFDSAEMRRLFAAYTTALIPDGGEYLANLCSTDIVDPLHTDLMDLMAQPNWFRRLRSRFAKSARSATIFGAFASTTPEQRAAFSDIDGYRNKFMKFWQQQKLDALVCPALASLALPPNLPPKLFVVLWAGCALYNLLDFSAGIVPCTYVTVADEEEATAQDDGDQDWITRLIQKHSEGTVGLPVGVQCVALPYREEVCLRLMKEIETAVSEEERKIS